jgi:hypothetical protein
MWTSVRGIIALKREVHIDKFNITVLFEISVKIWNRNECSTELKQGSLTSKVSSYWQIIVFKILTHSEREYKFI